MLQYIGDFTEDETIYLMFNTFESGDPTPSCTITNFANTDVHIHKDDGLTQRNNAAGITVSVDFDGITGSHMIKIDTSDNTVTDFWVVGHDYFVRIEGTTVDAATRNMVVGHFSIENRSTTPSLNVLDVLTESGGSGDLAAMKSALDGIRYVSESGGSGDLTAIKTQVDALLGLERDSGVLAAGAAEQSLFEDASPGKNKIGVVVKIDLTLLAAGDTYIIREKYKDESGGSYHTVDDITYTGAQSKPLRIIAMSPYRYGAVITAQKTAGTDRNIEWESFVGE